MSRAGTLKVAQETTNPTNAVPMQAVICQARSLNLPEEIPTRMPKAPDTRYGGHVKTRVTVLSKPRLPTTVGKKLQICQYLSRPYQELEFENAKGQRHKETET